MNLENFFARGYNQQFHIFHVSFSPCILPVSSAVNSGFVQNGIEIFYFAKNLAASGCVILSGESAWFQSGQVSAKYSDNFSESFDFCFKKTASVLNYK